MRSCIYRGTVTHARREPTQHAFTYRLFMMYLDLDELDDVFRGRWLWSTRRPALAWLRRADYLGDASKPLAEAVRDEAERLTGRRPAGPVRLLTHLRYFGYVNNPVSFYYCFAEDGRTIETILSQITNTPWKERHTYAVVRSDERPATGERHDFPKVFHVSPFMDMDHQYGWRFNDPGETITVHMENRSDEGKLFDASLSMRRQEISGSSLAAVLALYPLMTVRVVVGIYWQAFRLWLKRTPFYVHPAKRAA